MAVCRHLWDYNSLYLELYSDSFSIKDVLKRPTWVRNECIQISI